MTSSQKGSVLSKRETGFTGFLGSGDNFTIPCLINLLSLGRWTKSFKMASREADVSVPEN